MKKLLLIILCTFLIFILFSCGKTPSKVVGEYDNIDNLKSYFIIGGDTAYEIGANENGIPIFKNPDKALAQAKIDFADGFELIKKENNLYKISKHNYEKYKTYGWQTVTSDENIQKQCGQITAFLDFYENSFE